MTGHGHVPGLVRGGSYLGGGLPWTPEPIEDWRLVDDWTALGRLTEGAVRGWRTASHVDVAGTATLATAGLYRVVAIEPDALDAPRGVVPQTRRHQRGHSPRRSDHDAKESPS